MRDPALIAEADVLLVESTYGNRLHKTMQATEEELVLAINQTLAGKKGNVIVPAFAVGRAQEILYVLGDLLRRERIPRHLSIFVDSPMATRATEVTRRHLHLTDSESRALLAWQSQDSANAPRIRFTESVEDSMQLSTIRGGAIIISASGMCDAGRI